MMDFSSASSSSNNLLLTLKCKSFYLLACITFIWLFSAVCSLVPLHVVLLNEAHVTLVTAEWLFSCNEGHVKDK